MADVLWRDTALTPKIFILDARAVFPLALWLFHWAWWTAAIALSAACCRAIRVACMGRIRETRNTESLWRKRCRW